MNMRSFLRRAGIVTAISLSRLAKIGDKDVGRDFRSKKKRQRSVILYWALGRSAAEPEVTADLIELSQWADVVVISDNLDFEKVVELGVYMEALPLTRNAAMLPAIDWTFYVTRRVWRIREYWRPDFEIMAGQELDQYIGRLVPKKTKPAVRELEELAQADYPEAPG